LFQQCEQALPGILDAVKVDDFTYRQLVDELECRLQLEPGSLECIRPRLQATVRNLMEQQKVPEGTADQVAVQSQVSLPWKCGKKARYFAQFTWATPEKTKAVGPEERASLSAQITKLKDFKRKLPDGDLNLPEAKRLLASMREKLKENIDREGRNTVQKPCLGVVLRTV
jgi:hypothetical protein